MKAAAEVKKTKFQTPKRQNPKRLRRREVGAPIGADFYGKYFLDMGLKGGPARPRTQCGTSFYLEAL